MFGLRLPSYRQATQLQTSNKVNSKKTIIHLLAKTLIFIRSIICVTMEKFTSTQYSGGRNRKIMIKLQAFDFSNLPPFLAQAGISP
jgi:hypothetical protein